MKSSTLTWYLIVVGILCHQTDKIVLTAAEGFDRMIDIHYKMCLKWPMCNGTAVDQGVSCCEFCMCDSVCAEYGTCCPDTLAKLQQDYKALSPRKFVLAIPRFRKDFVGEGMLMMQSCPRSFTNQSVYDRCLMPTRSLSLEEAAPVTSRYDNVTYYNIFCALCNGLTETDVLGWQPGSIECERGFFFPENKKSLLHNLWDTRCNVVYNPPSKVDVKQTMGFAVWIAQCNATGLWKKYDEYIHTACRSYIAVFNNSYRNVFCYLCNGFENVISPCGHVTELNVFVSFSAVLNFVSDTESKQDSNMTSSDETCPVGFVYDQYQMKCRLVECYYGRSYYKGTCQQEVLLDIARVIYRINIELIPNVQVPVGNFRVLGEMLYRVLNNVLLEAVGMSFERMCEAAVYYVLDNNRSHYRYEIEIDSLNGDGANLVETTLKLDQSYQQFKAGKDLYIFYLKLYQYKVGEGMKDEKFIPVVVFNDSTCNIKSARITITNVLRCPLIKLHKNEITWTMNGSGIIIADLNLLISSNNFLFISKDEHIVHVCIETYIPRASEIAFQRSKANAKFGSAAIHSIGYLTFVCVLLSIISLLGTIFTYVLFPVLRTQPGINNITLSGALIIAQSLFQFAVGSKEDISHWVCVCFGLLTHFFWLFTIFSMNVCCIHMVRVFRNVNLRDHRYKAKTIILYNTYTSLCSSLFCVLNIVVSYLRSDGNSYGYGDADICYISSNLMIGLTFAFPAGAVVTINSCLFLFTVVRLYRVSEIPKANQQNKNMFIIYARLSSVTGLTWIFGFLYAFTNLSVFEYFFAIFNAGQGVLIMLAFVINKRIFGMYKSLVCKDNVNDVEMLDADTR